MFHPFLSCGALLALPQCPSILCWGAPPLVCCSVLPACGTFGCGRPVLFLPTYAGARVCVFVRLFCENQRLSSRSVATGTHTVRRALVGQTRASPVARSSGEGNFSEICRSSCNFSIGQLCQSSCGVICTAPAATVFFKLASGSKCGRHVIDHWSTCWKHVLYWNWCLVGDSRCRGRVFMH